MKLKFYILAAFAAVLAAGCAVEKDSISNEDEKKFLEAWMHVNYPEAVSYGNGIYIIDDKPAENGSTTVGNSGYAFVKYTISDLDGNISETSDSVVAKMIQDDFSPSDYYGNMVWTLSEGTIHRGVAEMLEGMTLGSTRKAVIPGWLRTYRTFSTPEEYMGNITGNSNAIYTVTVYDRTDDIIQWQIDSLERFSDIYLESKDSTDYGFYYKTLEEGTSEETLPKDTTVYIDYIGRLLNGQVFDTTIEDTAKMYNIYSDSKTYEPVSVTMAEETADIQLSGESTITGFAMTIAQMKAMEKGMGVFYSGLGYGSSGSGSSIPGYAPLIFEIYLVEEPED